MLEVLDSTVQIYRWLILYQKERVEKNSQWKPLCQQGSGGFCLVYPSKEVQVLGLYYKWSNHFVSRGVYMNLQKICRFKYSLMPQKMQRFMDLFEVFQWDSVEFYVIFDTAFIVKILNIVGQACFLIPCWLV